MSIIGLLYRRRPWAIGSLVICSIIFLLNILLKVDTQVAFLNSVIVTIGFLGGVYETFGFFENLRNKEETYQKCKQLAERLISFLDMVAPRLHIEFDRKRVQEETEKLALSKYGEFNSINFDFVFSIVKQVIDSHIIGKMEESISSEQSSAYSYYLIWIYCNLKESSSYAIKVEDMVPKSSRRHGTRWNFSKFKRISEKENKVLLGIEDLTTTHVEDKEIEQEIIGDQKYEKLTQIIEKVDKETLFRTLRKVIKRGEFTKYRIKKVIESGNKIFLLFKQEKGKLIYDRLTERGIPSLRARYKGPFSFIGSYFFVPPLGDESSLDSWVDDFLKGIPEDHQYDIIAIEVEILNKAQRPHGKNIQRIAIPLKELESVRTEEVIELLKTTGHSLEDLIEKASLDFFVWSLPLEDKERATLTERHDKIMSSLSSKGIRIIWDLEKINKEVLAEALSKVCKFDQNRSDLLVEEILVNISSVYEALEL